MIYYLMSAEGNITVTDDANEWALSLNNIECKCVGSDYIDEDTHVSTIFLGTDHNFFGDSLPLLFETMVFGGPYNESCYRCSTYDEAIAQHKRIRNSLLNWKNSEEKS